MQRVAHRPVAVLAATAAALLAACGSDGLTAMYVESEPGIAVVEARELALLTVCADEVTAKVSESDEAVRIDDIEGDPIDGADCQGGASLSVSKPIADRSLVVDGKTWRLLQGTDCPDGRFAPPDSDGTPGCEPVP
jgi:hypothetical protein